MKGIVFTEFAEMIHTMFGEDMYDDLIDATDPDSSGAYTSVGTYSHEELVNMVVELSNRTNIEIPKLIYTFGRHLGNTFATKFTSFFDQAGDTLSFLESIDNHIHVEVKKLYPDAELPEFTFTYASEQNPSNQLHYVSRRGFADLAHGLIDQAAEHYQEEFDISRKDWDEGEFHHCLFNITPK